MRKGQRKHSNIVFLPKGLRRGGDLCGGVGADFAGALEAEELAGRVRRFDDAVGDEGERVAGGKLEALRGGIEMLRDAERQ